VRRAILWAILRLSMPRQPHAPLPPEVPVRDGKLDEEDLVARLTSEVDEPRPSGNAVAAGRALTGVLQSQQSALVEGVQMALSRHRDIALRVLGDLDARPGLPALGPFTDGVDLLSEAERPSIDRTIEAISRRIVSPVAALLGHPDSAVRLKALQVYGKLGAPDLTARLERALRDPRLEVRIAALEVQRRGAVDRPALLRLATASLRAGHWRQRKAAVMLVVTLRDLTAAPALAGALRDANGFVREQAALGLGEIGAVEAEAPLIAALDDEVPHVRAAACQSLGKLKARGARARLDALKADPHPAVRAAAASALKVLP